MRRKANTPLHKFEEMQRDEPREEPPQEGGFVRTRNFRAVSLGRTTTAQRHREPPQETPRPTTSHGLSEKAAYEKAAYFDEVLSTRDGLK